MRQTLGIGAQLIFALVCPLSNLSHQLTWQFRAWHLVQAAESDLRRENKLKVDVRIQRHGPTSQRE